MLSNSAACDVWSHTATVLLACTAADQYVYRLYWAVTTLSMVEANSAPSTMAETVRCEGLCWPSCCCCGLLQVLVPCACCCCGGQHDEAAAESASEWQAIKTATHPPGHLPTHPPALPEVQCHHTGQPVHVLQYCPGKLYHRHHNPAGGEKQVAAVAAPTAPLPRALSSSSAFTASTAMSAPSLPPRLQKGMCSPGACCLCRRSRRMSGLETSESRAPI
jgi:hypothetical protein